jgi:Protein of unknown function (DUF2844)
MIKGLDNRPLTLTVLLRSARRAIAFTGLLFVAIGPANSAFAALGERAISAAAGRAKTQAAPQIAAQDKYTVEQNVMPSGTVVREFVLPTGVVFAVAWRGPMMPDLRQLLGQQFSRYVEVTKLTHRRHGPVIIEQPDLVVHSGGRMRSFVGNAYLPSLLPEGVSTVEIQ